MDRRSLIAAGLAWGSAALWSAARAQDAPASDQGAAEGPPAPSYRPQYPATTQAETYSRGEIFNSASDFFGVTSEAMGTAIEHVFKDNGQPTAYIAGEEGSAAFFGGVRYGHGLLYMKNRPPMKVYWRGPSIGFDVGGNASKCFTLCYNLRDDKRLFQRFPGVEGSFYFVAGLGVNYQRSGGVTLAPIRTGVGFRAGANVHYQAYSDRRDWFPL